MPTTFTGNEGGPIDIDIASDWTKKYRETNAGTKAHFFGSRVINQILGQKDCVGIRMYYALDTSNNDAKKIILVGADANGNDILPGHCIDMSAPCPNDCDTNNSPLYYKA